jgi:membrane protease YdiL (CAAX protease family)
MRGGLLPNPRLRFVSSATLLSFLAIPAAVLWTLGYRPLSYLGLGRWQRALPLFSFGVVAVIGSAFGIAASPAFRAAYGITVNAELALATLAGMLCLEFFFRGYLLLPMFEVLGFRAALIAAVPYAAVHLGKPPLEVVGSIPFALGMSLLAVRSGSILYGLALHWLLAITVNLLLRP